MKKGEIKAGVTYSTKNGNAARKVLCIGTQLLTRRWKWKM